ncbi:quinolinate synthetase complex, A subunit [gut metagenome]|uniref:quinolinate synthase n=1 Tax=gut metagenome TaxID=749906 RepID=J9GK81_9ZZZZ
MTQIKESWIAKGYVDEPIPEGIDLKTEIRRLCKEKNAVIMAHYYTEGAVQDIADFIGDSLALAQKAAQTEADIIVMCGVHFMGETNKILCPDKLVLIPDLNATCSLAESCPADQFAEFVRQHPDHKVISYVNTSAATKAVTDVVVTSTNARQIVESFPKDQPLIFGPDRNLGGYINAVTGRNMLLWNGACHVHERFSVEKLVELKQQYPAAKVLVHPECKGAIVKLADVVGSTAALLKYAVQNEADTFLVVTESGILHEMQKKAPHKHFIPVPPEEAGCACNECNYMRLVTLQKIYNTLVYEWPAVEVPEDIAAAAIKPIQEMLDISARLGL